MRFSQQFCLFLFFKNKQKIFFMFLALDSLVGGIIATSIVVTSEITKSNPHYWYLDETIGLITSMFLIAYGTW